nr:toxin [uncultured Halomonas sp.]
MKALFVELPAFQRMRITYWHDGTFAAFQQYLLQHPRAGDVIQGTDGLRKVRFQDPGRAKGKRGGVRVIYYWWASGQQFWLFTIYGKDVQDDLTSAQKKSLQQMLNDEIEARKRT